MHFFSKSHSFFKIYIQLLPFYSSLLASSSLRYHSLLDPQVLYASSADGLTFTAVPFCLCPMSATGLGTQEQSFSQLLFSACVLVIIPHTQGSLNMCLLTVTLVAVFMHWGWKRDFLSCNVLTKQTNKKKYNNLQQDSKWASPGSTGTWENLCTDLETISSLQGRWWELCLLCCLKTVYM